MCCFVLLLNDSGTLMSCFCFSMSCFGSRTSCFFHRTCVYRFFNSLSSPRRRFLKNNSRYSVVPMHFRNEQIHRPKPTLFYIIHLTCLLLIRLSYRIWFVVQKAYTFHMPCLREHVYWRNFAKYVFLLT